MKYTFAYSNLFRYPTFIPSFFLQSFVLFVCILDSLVFGHSRIEILNWSNLKTRLLETEAYSDRMYTKFSRYYSAKAMIFP